ncbi:MAG: DUF2254 domain-containing protein [Candidatus Eremiobacteraeota bacterium]|nr:DUF2254 domain-containing protein [Candidatus Eremiobacteraeota bacterium]
MRAQIVLPLVVAAAIVLTSYFLPRFDAVYFERPHAMSVASAQALLSAISAGMITLTAVVFSLAFLVLQFTVSSYSARLAPILFRDPIMYNALAVFVATFTYALGTLASVDINGNGIVPQYSIAVVGALLMLSTFMLLRLIQRLAGLEVYQVMRYLHDAGRSIIDSLPPVETTDATEAPAAPPPALPAKEIAYYGNEPKYVTSIDTAMLRRFGNGTSPGVVAVCAIGDCIAYGTVIARSYGTRPDDAKILRAFRFANERSLKTDLSYSIRLLVDTAVRALSPAVNDPTTAVQALDEIEGLLCRLAGKSLMDGSSWNGYIHLSFDEIRLCGEAQPLVMRRMRAAIIAIAKAAVTESRRAAALSYISSIDRSIAESGLDATDSEMMQHADRQGIGVSAQVWG